MFTFYNKYNIGDVVEYVKLGYRGDKTISKGEIQRIIFVKDKKTDCIRYLINGEQIVEEFILGKADV